MILLTTAGTIGAKAGTATAITYTIYGQTFVGGLPTTSGTVLAQGQLALAAGILYTVSASTEVLITEIHLSNATGLSVAGITFYVNGLLAVNQISGTITIPANGTAVFSNTGDRTVYDSTGASINGFSGFSGVSGYSGTSGVSGFSGISGYSGYTGVSGTSGVSGFTGASGTSGTSGYSGYTGVSGFSGYTGISGTSGVSGYSGYSGTSGVSGFTGASGVSGFTGASGVSGFSGYTGVSGVSGFSGYTGVSGTSGYSGYTGVSGVSGFSGYTGVSGFSGYTGVSGTSGISGRGFAIYNAVVDFGFVGDLRTIFDGAMTTGGSSTTLTCATSAPFVVGDIGKRITVAGAGASGAQLTTNIAGFTSSSVVTLTLGCSTTVTGKGVSFGTDNTAAITSMQNTVNNALYGVGIKFPQSVTNAYGFPTKVVFNKMVQIEGIGGGHTADSGDYTQIGGTRLAWWGSSSDSGVAFTPFITVASTGAQSIKRVAFRHLWIDCRNGDQNQALYALKLSSCHGFMIEDFFIMDALAVGIWTNISSTPTEAKDTTRFSIRSACFRQLDNPTGAQTTAITTTSAITFSTSGQTLNVASTTGYASAGYIWVQSNLGYPVLVNYTGLTGTSFTGCTVSSEETVNAPASVNGSNIVQAVPGNGSALLFDGGTGANTCCGVVDMIQISHGTTWGPAGLELGNSDSIMFKQMMMNGGNNTNDGVINRIRKPGVRINGSNTNDTLASRNNVFLDGDPGAGGVSAMGLLNTGTRLSAMSGPNYWDRMQLGNGAPMPTVEGNAYFDWNPNGGFRSGQRGSSLIADQAISAATLTSITGSLINVPPQGFQIGTTLRWYIHLTSGAAGTATGNIFRIKIGTNGTTADADTAVFTTLTAGTAVVSEVIVVLTYVVRTLGAAATGYASCNISNTGAAGTGVGFISALSQTLVPTMTTFNSTTAKQYFNVSLTTSTGKTVTVRECTAEVINPANP